MRSPFALLFNAVLFIATSASATAMAASPLPLKIIEIKVTTAGFEPASITAEENEPVQLKVTRVTDATCATEIVVPALKLKKDLPLNQTVLVDLGVMKKGKYPFGCAMDLMIAGVLDVGHSQDPLPKKSRR